MKVVIPLEMEISLLRVLMKSNLEEVEWVKIRYKQLNMINAKRLVAICHHQLYQKRIKKIHERKVQLREFKEGDLMLRKILPLPHEDHNKWASNYGGLFMVKKKKEKEKRETILGRVLILTSIDVEGVIRSMNLDFVKKYFV